MMTCSLDRAKEALERENGIALAALERERKRGEEQKIRGWEDSRRMLGIELNDRESQYRRISSVPFGGLKRIGVLKRD